MCPEFELVQVHVVVPGDSITAGVHARGSKERRMAEQVEFRKGAGQRGVFQQRCRSE